MSNPLYENVKAKVEASSLARDQFGNNPLEWHEDLLETERLRSLEVAKVFADLFARIIPAIANFGGAVDRARFANTLSTLDEKNLAAFGLQRTDLPGFVAGFVETRKNRLTSPNPARASKKPPDTAARFMSFRAGASPVCAIRRG